jgi:PAS domain S-box-containing protein
MHMKTITSKSNHYKKISASATLEECLTQKNNYEAIFNSMNEGLFIVNYDNNIVKCNDAFLKITGLKKQDVQNKNYISVFCQKPTCGLSIAVSTTLKTGNPCTNEATEILCKDGRKIPVVLSTSVLRDAKGSPSGIVILMHDESLVNELKGKLEIKYGFHNIIGKNYRMQEVYRMIEDLSATDATVLIQGESGTGKELVVHAIHYHSVRTKGPLVKVSCAALTESLLESELFGHVKGAFTGAYRDKVGRFQLANHGTIFLDEIGDVGPGIQVKLLRALQEREIERVGDSTPLKVDVRIIAATNKNLKEMVREGRFREDLFYRLNVIAIELPPLRERKDDIPLLVEYFIKKFNTLYNKNIKGVSHEALQLLMECDWEGNIRELEHAIEYSFIKTHSNFLMPDDFPHEIKRTIHPPFKNSSKSSAPQINYNYLLNILKETGWNQSKAARKMGINRVTLWRNIKKYQIIKPHE